MAQEMNDLGQLISDSRGQGQEIRPEISRCCDAPARAAYTLGGRSRPHLAARKADESPKGRWPDHPARERREALPKTLLRSPSDEDKVAIVMPHRPDIRVFRNLVSIRHHRTTDPIEDTPPVGRALVITQRREKRREKRHRKDRMPPFGTLGRSGPGSVKKIELSAEHSPRALPDGPARAVRAVRVDLGAQAARELAWGTYQEPR